MEFTVKSRSRLDRSIMIELTDKTRNHIGHLIKSGFVQINHQPIIKTGQIVRTGDIVTIKISAPISISLKPLAADLDIVHNDKNYLVINKPPHLPVHPGNNHPDDTLVNILAYKYPEFKDFGAINNTLRPGIVHRLDMNTSGLIVVAKNQATLNRFQQDIKDKKWQKIYLAWVLNSSQRSRGVITKNIIRHPHDRQKFITTNSVDRGKSAITHYEVVDNFQFNNTDISLVKVRIETGRTHQIRVHLLAENMPILGDSLYNNKLSKNISQKLAIKRQLLHAHELTIINPTDNHIEQFTAPMPADFAIKK